MGYVQPEVIAEARKVDLLSYLKATDPNELVKCDGNEYCTRSHDSLKISNGKWFWWSRGIGGASALDYLVKVKGLDFVSAVEAVLGKAVETPSFFAQKLQKNKDKLYIPKHTFNCNKAKEYLLDRGIDKEIIENCIEKKIIAEDVSSGYVVFLGYDDRGKIRYCCSRATDGSTHKKDMAGSDKRFAFNLISNEAKRTVRVFESAIDLLSFATMLKDVGRDYCNENLISLSGIYLPKEQVEETKIPMALEHYLDTHPKTKRICLYFDNDFAGWRGAEALQIILGGKYEVKYIPPPVGKDYNDYLMSKNQNQIKNERKNSIENSDQER